MSDYQFKGYSSFGFGQKLSLFLTDVELVKRDILNGLFTVKGSVPKNRKLGTSISVLLMKPMTDDLFNQLEDEIRVVLNNEPRIQTQQLLIIPDRSTKSVTINIVFVLITFPSSFETIDLYLNFED
mgnify:CR=1 FL=1